MCACAYISVCVCVCACVHAFCVYASVCAQCWGRYFLLLLETKVFSYGYVFPKINTLSKFTNKHEAITVPPFGSQQFVTVFMFLRVIFNVGTTEHTKLTLKLGKSSPTANTQCDNHT